MKPKQPLYLSMTFLVLRSTINRLPRKYGTKMRASAVSASRLVNATLFHATPPSRPSCHRFGPVEASPALSELRRSPASCDLCRQPGVKLFIAVPYVDLDKKSQKPVEFVEKKGDQIRRCKPNTPGEGSFRRPPVAEFGTDTARSFADHIDGVRGTGVRPRRCRWRWGSRQRGVY